MNKAVAENYCATLDGQLRRLVANHKIHVTTKADDVVTDDRVSVVVWVRGRSLPFHTTEALGGFVEGLDLVLGGLKK